MAEQSDMLAAAHAAIAEALADPSSQLSQALRAGRSSVLSGLLTVDEAKASLGCSDSEVEAWKEYFSTGAAPRRRR